MTAARENDVNEVAARVEAGAIFCDRCGERAVERPAATRRCLARDCRMAFCDGCAKEHEEATWHDLAPIGGIALCDARWLVDRVRELEKQLATLRASATGDHDEGDASGS